MKGWFFVSEIKIPRAIVRGGGDALGRAVVADGEWVFFKSMDGTSALQTARKYNGSVGGEDYEFGVDDDGNLMVRWLG